MPQFGSLLVVFAAMLCACYVRAEPLGFIREMRGRGLDIGGGLSVHLDTVDAPPNASIFERHALRVDFNGIGLRLGVESEEEGYKVGLYYGEGRNEKRKEVSELIIPALLGYKTSALIIMSLMGIGVIVLKALMVAKAAVIIAAAIWAKKYMGGGDIGIHHDYGQQSSEFHPVYAEYPGDISELGYAQTASGNYIAYAAPQQDISGIQEIQSATADTQDYSGVAADASNKRYSYTQPPTAVTSNSTSTKRREGMISKPQAIHTYITVKRRKHVRN